MLLAACVSCGAQALEPSDSGAAGSTEATGGRASGGSRGDADGSGGSPGGALPSDGTGGADEPWLDDPNTEALEVSDAELSAARGLELLDVSRRVASARGHALCVCLAPDSVEDPIEWAQTGCSAEESGLRGLMGNDMQERCIAELSSAIANFDDYLRCSARVLRENGRQYARCSGETIAPVSAECALLLSSEVAEAAQQLVSGIACEDAFYCEDDPTLHQFGRCSQSQECADLSDERACNQHSYGSMMVSCEGEVLPAPEMCRSCPALIGTELCDAETAYGSFRCTDGSYPEPDRLCDGAADCPDGEDELQGVDVAECLY